MTSAYVWRLLQKDVFYVAGLTQLCRSADEPLSTGTCVLDYVAYMGVLGGKGYDTPKHA
jgi:hypothetical protein